MLEMKKLSVFIVIVIAGVSFTGCGKSYLDINSPNPNNATVATPELVITNAMTVTASGQVCNPALGPTNFISGWMGYWAPSGSYATNNTDVASYYETNAFANTVWIGSYRNLEDYYYVENSAREQVKPYYVAMAKAMKSVVFSQLVDMFNNIPYHDAFQGTIVIQPKYEKGQDIYEDLSAQLDTVATLMASPLAIGDPKSDVMFGGDNASWIAFANTLRLRLLMRQSQMSGRDAYIKAEIAKIIANGGGFLTKDAAVNPGYANNDGQQNPLYGYFRTLTDLPTSGGQADYWRAAQYAISTLKDYNDTNRLAKIYAKNDKGDYVGCVLGSQFNPPGGGASSLGSGLLKSVSQNAIILSAAESHFLQAEAIVRGYLTGTAKTEYEAGVTASFAFLGASGAAGYLAQSNANTNWTLASGVSAQIAIIIGQKWIAMNGVTPLEAYADYRRLGMPATIPISISPYRNPPNSETPVRYLYPTSEYTTNSENVNAEGTIDYYTNRVFWNQ
jgi:Starch-binding associating with outer membrane